MNVVDQQNVCFSVLFAELVGMSVSDAGDHLVGEILTLDVDDVVIGMVFMYLVGDRVQQVSLTKTAGAVNEQRVVRMSGVLGYRSTRCVNEFIRRSDDEVLEGVF